MSERSGSFPLMNIATDFGVDYGDVLAVSIWLRFAQMPPDRANRTAEVGLRLVDALGYDRWGEFVSKMEEHHKARGGKQWWPA